MNLDAWLHARRDTLHRFMAPLFTEAWPQAFSAPLRYPIETGGKRVRPALVFAAYEALADQPDDLGAALYAAAALELVHTYSLVHDDLPDMDDDTERRGKPTVHVAFDPATAILVGDALLTEAFGLLARAPLGAEARIELVAVLSRAAGYQGMVGGQAADIGMGGRMSQLDDVLRLHRLKTGALLLAAVQMGAVVAGASAEQRQALESIGRDLGLAFQLVDDVFDAEDDEAPNVAQILGVPATREQARELATRAQHTAQQLPRPEALAALAAYVVERTY